MRRPDPEPRKRPTQARAQASWDALVGALERLLLAGRSFDQVTTNHLAETAGVSIGTLYQYFPSKEAVLAAWVEARLADDAEAMKELLDGRGTEEQRIRTQIRRLCERQHALAPVFAEVLPRLGDVQREALARRTVESLALELVEATLQPPSQQTEAWDVPLFVAVHGLRGALNAATVERPELLLRADFQEALAGPLLALLRPRG